MKKLASIFGASVITMAVAFTPVFAQTAAQNPQVPADTAKPKTEVTAKPPVTTPAPVVKTEKAGPVKAIGETTKGKSAKEEKSLTSEKAVKAGSHVKAGVSHKRPVHKFKAKKAAVKHFAKRSTGREKVKKVEKAAPLSGK